MTTNSGRQTSDHIPIPINRAIEYGSIRSLPNQDLAVKSRIATVVDLANALISAVEHLQFGDLPQANEDDGFYERVQRFEISLIQRALLQTAGSQVRAAHLLKMRPTTLNGKIKQYRIPLPKLNLREQETRLSSRSSASVGGIE